MRAAQAKKREQSQGRMKKAMRAYEDAHWDAQLKKWRVNAIEGERLFPLLVKVGDAQNTKEEDDSDTNDSLLERLLAEHLPSYNPSSEKGRRSLTEGIGEPQMSFSARVVRSISTGTEGIGMQPSRSAEMRGANAVTQLPEALTVPVTIGPIVSVYDPGQAENSSQAQSVYSISW